MKSMPPNGTDTRIRIVDESIEGRALSNLTPRQRDMLIGGLLALAALGGAGAWMGRHIDAALVPVVAQVATVSAQVSALSTKIDEHTASDAALAQRVARVEGAVQAAEDDPAYAGPRH